MLKFLAKEWSFDEMKKEFKDLGFAKDLINKLNQNGFTYAKADDKGFYLGNTSSVLTDKGNKYLKSTRITRWIIENSNNAIIWANTITLFMFALGLIFNCLINLDKLTKIIANIRH